METGTLSGGLARELRRRGLPVAVIDARQAHTVMRLQHNKTDANDDALLAEIAHRVLPPGGGEERDGAGRPELDDTAPGPAGNHINEGRILVRLFRM